MLGQYQNGKTHAIPSGHFLKSIEMQSVNSWVSLPPLRALVYLQSPIGGLSRKFCALFADGVSA